MWVLLGLFVLAVAVMFAIAAVLGLLADLVDRILPGRTAEQELRHQRPVSPSDLPAYDPRDDMPWLP